MADYKLEALSFTYPNTAAPALDGIDLEVREGEFLLVIGPSGGGKSTLLKHLKTVLAPHGERSGRVLFCGRELSSVPEREQAAGIGFVFQHPDDQLVTDKVWHELAFGLESLGESPERMRVRVAEMASYFGLESVFYKDVAELSGGQKQLLNLASVMAMAPEALVLDEPTSCLDPIAAFDFLTTVKKLNTELGLTVILSEHRLEEAMPFADRVIVLENGRITAEGAPKRVAEELYKKASPMFFAMPSAARLSLALGQETALTVNEGRRMLLSMGLIKKSLPGTEAAKSEAEPMINAKELFFRYEKNGEDVLRGLELNVTDFGKSDCPQNRDEYDVIILGYHKSVLPFNKHALSIWGESLLGIKNDPRRNAEGIIAAAEACRADIISHPNLYLKVDIPYMSECCRQLGILLEVNSSRVTLSKEELKTISAAGCGLIIGSDAHSPDRVGDFEKASAAVTEAGVWSAVNNARLV